MFKLNNNTCYKCGTLQSKENVFCTSCGTQINEVCSECSSIVDKRHNYCGKCGHDLK